MTPKWLPEGTQIDAKILIFFGPKFGTDFGAKKGDRWLTPRLGRALGGAFLDHESITLIFYSLILRALNAL